jgi:hypothetical protein
MEGAMSRRTPSFSPLILGLFFVLPTVVPALAQTTASSAALDRFVGTWREDESKRQMGQAQMIFRRSASGGVEEVRGGEAQPQVQQVVFDGKPHQIEDQNRNSITWRQSDANTFERVLANKAGVITTRRIRISADGKTLTEATERKTTDGRTVVTTVTFQRASGDATGLVGRWRGQSYKSTNPGQVRYERVGANALKFSNDVGDSYTLTFDDKPVTMTGAAVISGSMIAAKMTDDRTIETTSSRFGTVTARGKRVLSPDGRTLTVTNVNVGPNATPEPSVTVYVKQ